MMYLAVIKGIFVNILLLKTFVALYILEDFENASPYFRTCLAIEILLAGFNVQPRIGMNQSLI